MSALNFILPFRPAFDGNAKTIPGAQAWFTLEGTNAPTPPYATNALTTTLTNPVVANGIGRWPDIFLNSAVSYRVRIYDKDAEAGVDTPLEEYDPYVAGSFVVGSELLEPYATNAAAAAAAAGEAAADAIAAAMDADTSGNAAQLAEANIIAALNGVTLDAVTLPVASRALIQALDHTLGLPAYLTEENREGMFVPEAGDFTAEVTADPAQIAYVAWSTGAANGAWVRKTDALTPRMAGAANYDPDNEVWVHDELNAYFKLPRTASIARRYTFDWRGEWGIAEGVVSAYAADDVPRRYKPGVLRVAPLASLPGAVPLDVVFDVAGYRGDWDGPIEVHPSGSLYWNANPYATRRFKRGVRLRAIGGSKFGDFRVDDAKRDCVWMWADAGFTLDGIVFSSANNIGCKLGTVYGRTSGSNHRWSEVTPLVASAKAWGGVTAGTPFAADQVFTAVGGYAGSLSQQTKLTVPSTADLEVYDMVWCRVELTPAIYGTIAADNATSKITWTAGDPTDLDGSGNGLEVGDVYPLFNGGVNAGIEFRIVSFGGTSNREITVTPAPTSHAASADAGYTQYGEMNLHWVADVIDATNFTVFPWVARRINSTFHVVHGAALKAEGVDLANINIAGVIALLTAIGYYAKGLYAPKVETLLAESAVIGLRLADPLDGIHSGVSIEHGHAGIADGCDVSLVLGSNNVFGTINMQSLFDFGRSVASQARLTENAQRPGAAALGGLMIFQRGVGLVESNVGQAPNEGSQWDFYGISNTKNKREVFIHTDTATLNVTFDYDEARLLPKHHWARIIWTDNDGSDPDGTLTLNMDASLTALGWTFAGAGSGSSYAIVNPATSVKLEIQFLPGTKKVAITRFNGV